MTKKKHGTEWKIHHAGPLAASKELRNWTESDRIKSAKCKADTRRELFSSLCKKRLNAQQQQEHQPTGSKQKATANSPATMLLDY